MGETKNNRGKVTQGVFDAVKICLNGGGSITETAKFMKLSQDVVRLIRDAENLDEYKALMFEKCNRKNKQVAAIKAKEGSTAQTVEHKHSVTIQATHYMESELKKQTELLTMISNKIAFIVDELTK